MKKLIIATTIMLILISTGFAALLDTEPEIKELDDMKVVGISSLITLKSNLIPLLWQNFFKKMGEIENIVNSDVALGISYDNQQTEDDYIFFYMICYMVSNVDNIPQGLTYLEIPSQKYAVFTHKGLMTELMETYMYIYGEWLPNSDYEHDSEAYQIEWYDDRFSYESPDSEFDIYIPIK